MSHIYLLKTKIVSAPQRIDNNFVILLLFFLSSFDFLFKMNFFKISFRNTVSVSNICSGPRSGPRLCQA